MSKRNISQATKRYIFLFCWWLGLVVIWFFSLFALGGLPSDFFLPNTWYKYFDFVYFDPFFIVQSLPLWWILRKHFPGFMNWGWVAGMPFLANYGYWATVFIIAGITGSLGGRG